jgi:hypothetical protein
MSSSLLDTMRSLAPRSPAPRASSRFERMLALCGLLASVLISLNLHHPAIAAFELVVWLILPGWALLRRVTVADPIARMVCTGGTSVLLSVMAGLLMVWTGNWYPQPVAAGLLLAAAAAVFFTPGSAISHSAPGRWWFNRLPKHNLTHFLPWLTLGSATILWGVALAITDTGPLDDFGLLTKLPVIWYIAVLIVLALFLWGLVSRPLASSRIMCASLSVLVVMLYASAALLSSVPRLAWTYKHMAVTDFISTTGGVDPSLDIYNRWPGFFSASAFLGEAFGYPDALVYASWSEVTSALVDVFIVVAIARALVVHPRVYWTAGLVFALSNWVGQNYYSPQTFAFTLYLAMCLIIITFLRGTPIKVVRVLERRLARRGRIVQPASDATSRQLRTAAIVAVLVLQAGIAASHQLTPYLAVLGLLPLFVVGFFRPKWVGPALLAIAIIYLLPNWAYIGDRFGFFNGYDAVANATNRPADAVPRTAPDQWQEIGLIVLSALTGILAVLGFVRNLGNGQVRTTMLVGWLAVAPGFVLFVQAYGGEALLRVYLFSLPWLAIGAGWFFWSDGRGMRAGDGVSRRRSVAAITSLSAMAILFIGTYLQPELDRRVPAGEVAAAKWLDARAQSDDLILGMHPVLYQRFPFAIGANYYQYAGNGLGAPSVSDLLEPSPETFGVDVVKKFVADYSPTTTKSYIIFSDSQVKNAIRQDNLDPTLLPRAEQQLASSGAEKVLDTGAVRIYLLTTPGAGAPTPAP